MKAHGSTRAARAIRSVSFRPAFTLIELLVVVAIIALLISILLPSLAGARENAQRVRCAANEHQVGLGLGAYSSDYRGMLPVRGGYAYNTKETHNYHWWKGSSVARMPVNHGALSPKYSGSDGLFYFCPANRQWGYDNPNNGWGTFKWDTAPPGPATTFGGYHYAVPVVPGCYAKDDGKLSFTVPGSLLDTSSPSKAPAAPVAEGYGGLYDSRLAKYPPPYEKTEGYVQIAFSQWYRQRNSPNPTYTAPYMGRSLALFTDALFGEKAHKAKGYNVLFTDYHAKWVPGNIKLTIAGSSNTVANWSGTSGNTSPPPPRMGMWNVLSSRP